MTFLSFCFKQNYYINVHGVYKGLASNYGNFGFTELCFYIFINVKAFSLIEMEDGGIHVENHKYIVWYTVENILYFNCGNYH